MNNSQPISKRGICEGCDEEREVEYWAEENAWVCAECRTDIENDMRTENENWAEEEYADELEAELAELDEAETFGDRDVIEAAMETIEVPVHTRYQTTWLGAGQIKATAPRTQTTRHYQHDESVELNHRNAAWAVLTRFAAKMGLDLADVEVTLLDHVVEGGHGTYQFQIRY